MDTVINKVGLTRSGAGTVRGCVVPPRKPSRVGAHVPVARGLVDGGLGYATQVGAEVVQVFLSNPRGWRPSAGEPGQDAAFAERTAKQRIPVFVHATYLLNFGSPSDQTLESSVRSLEHTLTRSAAIGARGVVVHTGSAIRAAYRDVAMRQLHERLLPLLDAVPDGGPDVLFEPTAGGGAALCARVEDLEAYLAALDWHPRAGVCLDTCHVFAAGHDLATPGGVRATLRTLVRSAGKGRLRLVHANDSKDPLGSRRDRHANIGDGMIGAPSFAELFRHPATRNVPLVVETPGNPARCAEDIATLKELRAG